MTFGPILGHKRDIQSLIYEYNLEFELFEPWLLSRLILSVKRGSKISIIYIDNFFLKTFLLRAAISNIIMFTQQLLT